MLDTSTQQCYDLDAEEMLGPIEETEEDDNEEANELWKTR